MLGKRGVTPPTSHSSSSTNSDSDLDKVPLSQKFKTKITPSKSKTTTKAKRSHKSKPFKPAQKPNSPIVVDSPATAEEQVVTEKSTAAELSEPPTNNQQQNTSTPLNQTSDQQVLSNLESHYSGELPEYQQNATENPPTQTQEKTIPESVMETVAEESIQVIESELIVSVSHSEPTHKTNPSASDQPSSSSSPIQIFDEPPSDILDPDYLDNQLAEINKEMQTLLNLRKTPFLPLAYQDRWSSVKLML